jgi:hypothetical protein
LAQESQIEVSVCDLARDPKSFDGKTVRVRGTLNVDFEDFSLDTPNCDTQQGIWLAFGGDVPGLTPSTANDMVRKPGTNIRVEGVSYAIKKDDNFRRLYALIAARHGDRPAFRVTATLTGAFVAGLLTTWPSGLTVFAGYGHLGCCALLVITEVSEVDSVPPANLNVRGTVLRPDGNPAAGLVVFNDILGGSPPERQQTTTDDKGEFAFSNSGQLLRFEDPRYRPIAFPVEPGGSPVRVRLEDAEGSDWVVPPCSQVAASQTRIGFSVLFALPSIMDSDRFDDDAYNVHHYSVFARGSDPSEGELMISMVSERTGDHSSDVGLLRSQQRWIKDSAGNVMGIDSRTRPRSGGRSRQAFFWDHDIAGYWSKNQVTLLSGILDRIIDSACIAKW